MKGYGSTRSTYEASVLVEGLSWPVKAVRYGDEAYGWRIVWMINSQNCLDADGSYHRPIHSALLPI
jgi:hypothetical protein